MGAMDEKALEEAAKALAGDEWNANDAPRFRRDASDAIRAYLSAAAQPEPVPVLIKPLEWKEGQAFTQFGDYSVDYDHDEDMEETPWVCWSPVDSLGHFPTAEEAVAAAQADFEARIRSALPPTPQAGESQREPVAWTDEAIIELAVAHSNYRDEAGFEVMSHARIIEFARELLAAPTAIPSTGTDEPARSIPAEPTVRMSAAGMRIIKNTQVDHFHKYAGGIANSVYDAMVRAFREEPEHMGPTPVSLTSPVERAEPVAWLDMRSEPAADWTKRVVATNPEFVTANGAENFAPLGILVASKR